MTPVGDPSNAIEALLLAQGPLGIACLVLGYVAWKKDKDLIEEKNARIADAKGYNDLALKLKQEAIDSVNKLYLIFKGRTGDQP